MNQIQDVRCANLCDENLNPAGGHAHGLGLSIEWQRGPLNGGSPNGAFIETVLAVCLQRLGFYQAANGGKFKCRENAIAMTKIEEALMWLDKRTQDREARGVEGTNQA